MPKKSKRQVFPTSISVSRNVLEAASDFDALELNIIILLLDLLRPYMYMSNVTPDPGELFLRFSSFSNRHGNREDMLERINRLRQKDIRYRITTPGVQLQVITGLFSSVIATAGGILARVSPEAIPWLLYIGRGVGYARIEPELFLGLGSAYLKRLYLLLCVKAYKGFTSFVIHRDQLYEVIGIPKSTPTHDVLLRYLTGLQKYLDQKESMFRLSIEPVMRSRSKVGRPAIESFAMVFNLRPEYIKESEKHDPKMESLNLLRMMIPTLQKRKAPIKTAPDIFNELIAKDCCQAFVQAMSAYSQKTLEHQANIMPKILYDRFSIDVYHNNEDATPNK